MRVGVSGLIVGLSRVLWHGDYLSLIRNGSTNLRDGRTPCFGRRQFGPELVVAVCSFPFAHMVFNGSTFTSD